MKTPSNVEAAGVARLPPELAARLQTMIRRVRRIIWLRGLLATGAVLLGCALAIMAVDAAVLIFSPAIRWGLSGLGLVFTLATAWTVLVRPLSRRLTLTRMARVLETRHPELQERISSAIELLSMGGDAASRGSEQLIALLAQDAQADMRAVQPRREFSGRSVKPVLTAAVVVAAVFGLLFAAWPRQTVLLFKRAVAPYEDFATLQGEGLAVEPGDVVRLQGEELFIRLRVRGGGAGRAEVRCRPAAGPETVERMRRVSVADAPEGVFELTFPSVTEPFRYRVRYGAGLSRYYEVNVLPPPSATRLAVTCRYPAYTRQAERVLAEGSRDIAGVAGTRVVIDADFNRRADAEVLIGERRFPATAKPTPGATWNLVLSTNMADRWSLALRDEYGFTGRVEQASLKVIPDRAPAVITLSPHADRLTLPPYGQVPLAFQVSEDFGVSRAELVIRPDSGPDRLQPFTLQADGKETWSGTHELDLARMQLGGLRQFKVWLRVLDTVPPELGGPQRGESRPVTISLDASAKRIEDQLREEQKKTLQEMLKAAADRLGQSASQVGGVKGMVSEEPLKPAVVQALTVAQERAATAEDLVKRAADLCDKSYFRTLTQRLRDTASEAVEPARARTSEILFSEAARRADRAGEAAKALSDAATRVLELIAAIDALDRKLAELSKTAELAQREKALADEARERKMTQAELEAWKKEQEKIARELAAQNADSNAVQQAREKMAEAQAAMNQEKPTAKDDQEQKAARAAEKAAEKAADAAEKAKDAAEHAEDFARDRKAAEATEQAAKMAEDAAKQAEKAAVDAKDAAQKQRAEEKAEDARDRRNAAQKAQDAAQDAQKAATQAEQAAQKAEAAAQQQEQGQAQEAGKKAEDSKKDAKEANDQADKARQNAQQAAEQAKREDAAKAEQGANLAKEAADMADRAADLAREADDQTQKAEHLPNEQRQAQTQQAADKAHQAAEMAKQAADKAREAGQKAAEEMAAAQQAEQAAAREAGTPEQIQAAAKRAGQEAKQAAKMAQEAANAAKQATEQAAQTRDPAMQEAAKQGEEAAQMAEQAAQLAEQAEQRIEKTEGKNLPHEKEAAENKRATDEANAAAQLAREAAQKARDAAKTAAQEMAQDAQEAKQGAQEAAQEANEAAQQAAEAAQTARQAGSEQAQQAAELGKKAGEMAKEAGEMVKDAMQNAEKGTEQGDRQGMEKAEQAAAKAEQASEMAKKASSQAKSAEKSSENARDAAQHAQEASQQMSDMAEQQAAKEGQNMKPPEQWRTAAARASEEQKNRQDTKNLGERGFMPVFLKNLGLPESEWARFKGKTESEAMDEMLKAVSPEYRELVRRYFVELSREGGKAVEGLK
jgi:hypothetical protein